MKIYHPIFLGVINLALVLLLSPLFEGIIRKLKATLHSRKGPPIIQPYLDLLKLLGKEDLRISNNFLIGFSPVLCLASIMVVALLIPIGAGPPLSFAGDVIVLIYFISLAAIAVMLGALSSESPYSYIGMSREMMLSLSVEIIIVISLLVGVVRAGSFEISKIIFWYLNSGPALSMVIAAVPFFLVIQAQLGKLPFDIPEADQEIMEGPFIEASGPRLALFKWSFYAKQIIFTCLFVEVFIPWPKLGVLPLDILITLGKALIVILIVGLIDIVNPRLRIDQAIRYFMGVLILSLVALSFAVIGA